MAIAFIGVKGTDETRRADQRLTERLAQRAGIKLDPEELDYEAVIDRLVEWKRGDPFFLARATPYVYVVAEMLGAEIEPVATYVSTNTGATTYHSYLVVNRAGFPHTPTPSPEDVVQFIAHASEKAHVPRFVYHNQFSTSSYLLPLLFFRSHDIFQMGESEVGQGLTRIISQRQDGVGAFKLVQMVASNEADIAAVWDDTKTDVEQGDKSVSNEVAFVQLNTAIPNDLLVWAKSTDSDMKQRVARAISEMESKEIGVGDFATWQSLVGANPTNRTPADPAKDALADRARHALAELRWVARERPPAVIQCERPDGPARPPHGARIRSLIDRLGSDRVFKDTDSIRPGEKFVDVITRELETCSVFLAVIGKEWATVQDPRTALPRIHNPGDFLRLEVATALKSRRVLVIPVLVNHARMLAPDELPEDLRDLCLRNAFELSDIRWDADVQQLILAIEKACSDPRRRRVEKTAKIARPKQIREGDVKPVDARRVDEVDPQSRGHRPVPVPSAQRGWLSALTSLESRTGITALLAVVFLTNWIETLTETAMKESFRVGNELPYRMAAAMMWLERGLTFEARDLNSPLAVYGGSAAYFFVYPFLLLLTIGVLLLRRDVTAYRVFAVTIAVTYIACVGCYLLVPVPERWAFPDAHAVLLSDRWSTLLIKAIRPISGLDNCFPSFHVASSMEVILVWYVYRLRFRLAIAFLAVGVMISTFLIGIHWLADIVAGAALGVVSIRVALALEGKRATQRARGFEVAPLPVAGVHV